MVFVACVVNQLHACYEFHSAVQRLHESIIYLISGDKQRTNFPVNASKAHNAHDSFAISAMKERDVVRCGPFTIRLFPIMHERCFPSVQTFSLNAHSLCNPCSL